MIVFISRNKMTIHTDSHFAAMFLTRCVALLPLSTRFDPVCVYVRVRFMLRLMCVPSL